MNDLMKLLIEKSVAAGRLLQSPQTGFVHYCHQEKTKELAHTIPIYENLLFVLSLFRTHRIESMEEGKEILLKLLRFQNSQTGEFPLYLHLYPEAAYIKDLVNYLAPFYWILKEYGHVIGQQLRTSLERSISLLLSFCLHQQTEAKIPSICSFRLGCAATAFGKLMQRKEWIDEGEKIGQDVLNKDFSVYSPAELGEIWIGLQMLEKSEEEKHRFEDLWNPTLCTYSGPYFLQPQEKEEPSPCLYDLYMGLFAKNFSKRALNTAPFHLQGALIRPIDFSFSFTQQHPFFFVTGHPFKFLWGNTECLHSFVCEGGESSSVETLRKDNKIHLIFSLEDKDFSEGKEKKGEIEFFIDFHPSVQFLKQEQRVNTFTLKEEICLHLGEHRFKMTCNLIEGTGHFFGHIMRGNRPSQTANKGEQRFQSYDWLLFLRTVRRKEASKVCVTFEKI